MTYSFIKAVKTAGPAPTYGHLLNLMCSAIREAQSRLTFDENYTSSDASAVCYIKLVLSETCNILNDLSIVFPSCLQEPLLTSSEEFDVYATKFIL